VFHIADEKASLQVVTIGVTARAALKIVVIRFAARSPRGAFT